MERNNKEIVAILLDNPRIRPNERNRKMECAVQIAVQFHFGEVATMIKNRTREMPARPARTAAGTRPRRDYVEKNAPARRPQTAFVRSRGSAGSRLFSANGKRPKLAQPSAVEVPVTRVSMKETVGANRHRRTQLSTRREKKALKTRARLAEFTEKL